MNKFQVGDVVRAANLVDIFGDIDLIISQVEPIHDRWGGEELQWVSINGFPQSGSHTYMSTHFKLVDSGVYANE